LMIFVIDITIQVQARRFISHRILFFQADYNLLNI